MPPTTGERIFAERVSFHIGAGWPEMRVVCKLSTYPTPTGWGNILERTPVPFRFSFVSGFWSDLQLAAPVLFRHLALMS
jgi:hypothetical protein